MARRLDWDEYAARAAQLCVEVEESFAAAQVVLNDSSTDELRALAADLHRVEELAAELSALRSRVDDQLTDAV